MPWYEGPCRITVVGLQASWPQRVVVSIRRGATVIIPGTVGAGELIDDAGSGHGWDLAVEHQYEGVWRPNIRAVLGKWTDHDGVRSQLIHSKDYDWPGRDNRERNLVIRIDRADRSRTVPGVLVGRSAAQETTRVVTGRLSTPGIPARWAGTESQPAREQEHGGVRSSGAGSGAVRTSGAGQDAVRTSGAAGQGGGRTSAAGQGTVRASGAADPGRGGVRTSGGGAATSDGGTSTTGGGRTATSGG